MLVFFGQVVGVENVPIGKDYIDSMERVLELVVREKDIPDKDLEQELEKLIAEEPAGDSPESAVVIAEEEFQEEISILIAVAKGAAKYKDPVILRELLLQQNKTYSAAAVQSAQTAIEDVKNIAAWKEIKDILKKHIVPVPAVADEEVDPSLADADEIATPAPFGDLDLDEGESEVGDPMDPAAALVNPLLVVTADADPLNTNLPPLDTGHNPLLAGSPLGDGLLKPPAAVDPSKTTEPLAPTAPKAKTPPKVAPKPMNKEQMVKDYNKILEEKGSTQAQIALLADFVSGVEKLYRITIKSDGTLRDEGNKQAWKGMWTDSKGNEHPTTSSGCLSSQEKEALRAFCPEKLAGKLVEGSFDSDNPNLDLAKNVSEHFTNPSNLTLITDWVREKANELEGKISKTDKPSTTLVNKAAKSLQEITASKNVKAAHRPPSR